MDNNVDNNETNVVYMYGDVFNDDTVTIPKAHYEELVEDQQWLYSLEAAGVNSWEGYDFALRLFDEENAVED